MNKTNKTTSKHPNDWQEIDWKSVNKFVEEIQEEIVKAELTNDINKVYKLQRKLVTTIAGRALAIRRVVTNQGGKTGGVDDEVWKTPEQRFRAIEELGKITREPKKYKAKPVRRVYIPKPGTSEKRPLGIPTMMDRAVQAVYHLAVDPVVECRSDPNSYGFRKYRSTQDAITTLRSLLDKKVSPEWIFETDVAKCFDRIDHPFLMKNTPICDKNVLEQWLKSGIQIGKVLEYSTEGTPQGGVISPMLCNVTLNGMEERIRTEFFRRKVEKETGLRPKVNVIRYADDIVITGSSPDILKRVRNTLEEFLKERGLHLKEAKTRTIKADEGFEFLGYHIQRYEHDPKLNKVSSYKQQDSVLVVKPTKKGIQRVKDKIRAMIQYNKPIEAIIRDLNPILRGWAEYYRISYHSQEGFISLGHFVYKKMWNWARKKHVDKTAKEIVQMYIQPGKSHKWTWGRSLTETLINLSEVTTWVLRPLKLDLNPYILTNKEYFETRRRGRIAAKFRAAIYRKYNHVCPVCEDSLHNGEPIELHHIRPVKDGGKYTMENIQPLHRICHQKVTHTKKVS